MEVKWTLAKHAVSNLSKLMEQHILISSFLVGPLQVY